MTSQLLSVGLGALHCMASPGRALCHTWEGDQRTPHFRFAQLAVQTFPDLEVNQILLPDCQPILAYLTFRARLFHVSIQIY